MGCRATRSLSSPLLFSLSFLFLAAASHGQDTLTQGKSLQDGQTLVSLGRVFELGFFTPPGANSSLRYAGVWYYGLRPLALIWVANRNNPVLGSSGQITISSDGNMEVLDGGGGRRWSTNESSPPAPPGGASAVLHLVDTGNLFLNASEGGAVRWQSFEHPTDTFLPGMRVILDKATGQGLRFRSWRSESDPAEGNYSLGLDPAGSGQVFIWGGETPRWRSGVLSGGMFTGIRVKPLAFYGWNLDDPGGEVGEMVLTFRPFNASLIRFALQWDGRVNSSVLDSRTRGWRTAIVEPGEVCDLYNRCGANAVCVAGEVGACECLKGFQPRVTGEWKAGNRSGGCARRRPVRCEANGTAAGEEDGFWVVKGVKLPDGSSWRIADEGGCERGCVGNCSCTAFAYTAEVGCLTWSAALADVQQFPDGGIDLHVKLAGSELGNGHKNKIWIVVLIIALFVVVVFLLSFYLCWRYRAKKKGRREKSGTGVVSLADPGDRGEALPEFINPTQFVDQTKDGKSSELPLLSFDSIAAATGNFSESNKLGEGGFGLVYKGILPDGREIAVKRLSETSGQGLEEFKNEVILIAKLQHRNLVRLMACCIQETEKILIYEYLPNKSLDAFIFDPEKKPLLDWRKRFDIIEGIARGLVYLHRDSRLRIIHRDLKASNILLDEEMNPKISDFGMARIFGGNQNQLNTNRVVGTFGYMSPEYAMEGVFSIKSDVFSFGVLILEIISGQRNSGFPRTENSPNLVGYAWKLWNEERPLELVDPSMQSSISPREVLRCIQVGLLCVQDRANERPTMTSVVFMLGNEAMAQPMPKQPTFTLEGSPTETESVAMEMEAESFASRDVSISVVTGR